MPWVALLLAAWLCSSQAAASSAEAGSSDESPEAEAVAAQGPQADSDESASRLWSLERVLERTKRVAATRLISESREREAEAQRREARALRLPRAEATFGAAPAPRVGDDDLGSSDLELLASLFEGFGPALRGEFSIGVPLFTFGKISLAIELAELGVEAARVQSELAELETLFQTYRAYAALQWYSHVSALLSEAAGRLDDAEEVLEDRLDDGDRRARTELRRLTIMRATLVRSQVEARQVANTARYGLSVALDLPEDLETEPWESHAQLLDMPTWEETAQLAQRNRPELILLEHAVEARDLAARLEWRKLTPDLLFLANIGGAWAPTIPDQHGLFVYDPYNRFGAGVALGLRWSLDVFQRRAAAQRLEARAQTTRHERDAAWTLMRMSLRQAWEEAAGSAEVLSSAEAALRAARAWLNQTAFQFEQGFASFEDLADPLGTYYDVAGKYWEAALAHRLRIANLAIQAGLPPDYFEAAD